jgi:phosphoenolpyruvate synthase/pyruvate phosphate dikinase
MDLSRQLAGEKGAVLARLAADPKLAELGVEVPGGQVISPPVIASLLKAASAGKQNLYELWQTTISDPDFLTKSELRLGTATKPGRLSELKERTKKSLTKLLLDGNKPTKRGAALLKSMGADPALKGKEAWILRSSFTGEDRPNKSGAGQYSSFPNAFSARQRLEGLIGVIASMWNEGAVESNLGSGIKIEHVFPSVVVQKCLAPTVSGVAVSRGVHGGFGQVSYQAKPKFGGGVDGGAAEEGVLGRYESSLSSTYKGKSGSLLTRAQQEKLRAAILAIEELFEREIEPGQKHAVDVEWAFVGSKLHILQARVINLE